MAPTAWSQAVRVDPAACSPCELARGEDVGGLGLCVDVHGFIRACIRVLHLSEIHAFTPDVGAAGDVNDSRGMRRGVGGEDLGKDEGGEKEWTEVVCGELLLESIGGELESADRGRGIIDENLQTVGLRFFELKHGKPHVDLLRIRVDLRRSCANSFQRGKIEDQRPDICAGDLLLQRVF